MVRYAARHGVRVLGVTLSRQQALWAQKAIATRHEARGVDEDEQRDAEALAGRDEAGALLGGGDVDHPRRGSAVGSPTTPTGVVVVGDEVADAVAVVHGRPAERLGGDVLADGLLHHPRSGGEHRRRAGHDDEVRQRRRVAPAAGRGPGDDGDLRHDPVQGDVLEEDPAEAAERGGALLQPRAGRLEERDERRAAVRANCIARTTTSASAVPTEPPLTEADIA